MAYLMIQNPVKSIPSVELMRMLGASSSRGNAGRIGQFGSGFPYSLALLARTFDEKGNRLLLGTKICLGKDVYTFEIVDHDVRDSSGNRSTQYEIRMKKQNGASWDLNIDVTFGVVDWRDVKLAVREFVSNAIDGTYEYGGKPANDVVVDATIPDEGRMTRAKEGFVRIYIPVNDDIQAYVDELPKYFRCLQPGYDPSRSVLLNTDGGPARIYRKGVLVGSFGKQSLFHYNINDIQINESRIVDEYTARHACAEAIINSKNVNVITKFMSYRIQPSRSDDCFENRLYIDYMSRDNVREESLDTIMTACTNVVGHRVVCDSEIAARMIESKGKEALLVDSATSKLLRSYGAPSAWDVLSKNELEGREIVSAPPAAQSMLDTVWDALIRCNMTLSKDKPNIACFVQHSNTMAGYYRPGDGCIYIRIDTADGITTDGMTTILHECNHYITGADDLTQEFADFAHKFACMLLMEKMSR